MMQDELYSYAQERRIDKQKAQQEKLQKSQQDLEKAFLAVGETREGVRVLQHIMRLCHPFDSPAAVASNGDTCPNKILFNLGRQSVWSEIRRTLDRETRIKVEYPDVETELQKADSKGETK